MTDQSELDALKSRIAELEAAQERRTDFCDRCNREMGRCPVPVYDQGDLPSAAVMSCVQVVEDNPPTTTTKDNPPSVAPPPAAR